VVAASGCGKSTLLKLVAGLLPPTQGEIQVSGHAVTRPHRDVGIVFQSALLLPWRSVLGNVMLPVEVKRLAAGRYRQRALAVLLITHSIPEAVFLSDRVVVMTARPGTIAAEYDVELPRPRALGVMGGAEFGELTRNIRRHFHAQGSMD